MGKIEPIVQSALRDYPYDALDDILYDHYCWERGYKITRGYSNVDKSFSLSSSSNQWQSSGEIMDEGSEDWKMLQVSSAVDSIDSDYQLAIRIEQQNREGPKVWRNPRAGDRQPEVYAIARQVILPILRRKIDFVLDK